MGCDSWGGGRVAGLGVAQTGAKAHGLFTQNRGQHSLA
jgi:hypothetical protein